MHVPDRRMFSAQWNCKPMTVAGGGRGKHSQQQRLRRLLLLFVVTCLCIRRMPRAEAAAMKVDWTTCASPNTRPDVSCCTLPDLMRRPAGPRAYKELAEYLQENPLPEQSRVRPAAHLVARNATYLEQLNRAYRLMRELPSTDPRSHAQQVNLHCMYGNSGTGIVMQQAPAGVGGEPRREYSTHRNWYVPQLQTCQNQVRMISRLLSRSLAC